MISRSTTKFSLFLVLMGACTVCATRQERINRANFRNDLVYDINAKGDICKTGEKVSYLRPRKDNSPTFMMGFFGVLSIFKKDKLEETRKNIVRCAWIYAVLAIGCILGAMFGSLAIQIPCVCGMAIFSICFINLRDQGSAWDKAEYISTHGGDYGDEWRHAKSNLTIFYSFCLLLLVAFAILIFINKDGAQMAGKIVGSLAIATFVFRPICWVLVKGYKRTYLHDFRTFADKTTAAAAAGAQSLDCTPDKQSFDSISLPSMATKTVRNQLGFVSGDGLGRKSLDKQIQKPRKAGRRLLNQNKNLKKSSRFA